MHPGTGTMSSSEGGQEQLPDVRQWVADGGDLAQGGQQATEAAAQAPQWSEDEWRLWNQWRWGWQGTSTYWSWSVSGGTPGVSHSEAAGTRSPVAAGAPIPDSGQQDPLVGNDPWRSGNGDWSSSTRNDKWWGNSKGDFADPPSWPGWGHYRLWRKSLLRWNGNTDVAQYRRAEKVLKSLDWDMQSKLDHLSEEVLSSSNYLDAIFQVLDVLAGEREDSEKRRAIRAALYEGGRRTDETLAQYALRRESQFTSVSKYLNLPDELKAIMLEEQSGLSKQGTQNLRVLTEGRHDYSRVRRALQILDTEEESLFKAGRGNYLQFEEEDDAESYETDEDEIDEEVFLAIQDKDMDEDEALIFLAEHQPGFKRRTWAENKQLKAARKKDRRHFEDRGSRPPRPPGKKKIPKSELVKVTRCGNCGERGHWKEDCTRPYRSKASRERDERIAAGSNAFVFLGASSQSSEFKGSFLLYDSWTEGSTLNLLALPSGHAIVDPGASQDLIGLKSFERLCCALRKNGLKVVKLEEKPSPASGVGGDACPLFSVLVPCVLGGKPGIIKMTVVREDIPQLLSAGLLEHAGAVIDLGSNKIDFKSLGSSMKMTRLGSGHRIIDISQWDKTTFPVPEQLKSEFRLKPGAFDHSDSESAEAYMGLGANGMRDVEVVDVAKLNQMLARTPLNSLNQCELGCVVQFDVEGVTKVISEPDVNLFPFQSSWIVKSTGEIFMTELSNDRRKHQLSCSFELKPGDRCLRLFSCLELQWNASENSMRSPVASSSKLNFDDSSSSRAASHGSAVHGPSCDVPRSCISPGSTSLDEAEREPLRQGKGQLVLHGSRTTASEEGTHECSHSGNVGHAGHSEDNQGRVSSSTSARDMPSSSELCDQGWEPARKLEALCTLQPASGLQEVLIGEPTSSRREEEEGRKECDAGDIYQHGAAGGHDSYGNAHDSCAGNSSSSRTAGDDGGSDRAAESGNGNCHVSGDGPSHGNYEADGGEPALSATDGAPATASADSSHIQSAASHAGADCHCLGGRDGRCGGLDRPSLVSARSSSLTEQGVELRHDCDSAFDADQFQGKLNMSLLNHLVSSQSENSYCSNIRQEGGKLFCSFVDEELGRDLFFGSLVEDREVQLTKRVKKQLRQSVQALSETTGSHEIHVACAGKALCHANEPGCEKDLGHEMTKQELIATTQTASRADKARTARKEAETASHADKARTARNEEETASHAAKARTARKEIEEALSQRDLGPSLMTQTAAPFTSPSGLSSLGHSILGGLGRTGTKLSLTSCSVSRDASRILRRIGSWSCSHHLG